MLVQYVSQFKKHRYRLARVVEVETGRDGLVRTVVVVMRNMHRGAREHLRECKAGVTRLRLPVQRLVVILPGKDQPRALIDQLRSKEAPAPIQQDERAPAVRVASEGEEIMDL